MDTPSVTVRRIMADALQQKEVRFGIIKKAVIGLNNNNNNNNIQPLGQFGQEPEPSQATGMALVRCILGKFLGVVCHCLPSRK